MEAGAEVYGLISRLLDHACAELGLDARNRIAVRNALFDMLGIAGSCECEAGGAYVGGDPTALSDALFDACSKNGITGGMGRLEFSDRVMSALIPDPATVNGAFAKLLKRDGKLAADMLYSFSVNSGYVKRSLILENTRFVSNGYIVTVNRIKPEFRDPAAAKRAQSGDGYPKCVICRENEGYAAANKRTLRTVDITLGGEEYFWQYSPFGYFNEHGIAVNREHIPMYIDEATFIKLMDFTDMFPHYFIGCNAALPGIGGSVLAHDHYQGGGEILPLHTAGIKRYVKCGDFKDVKTGIVDWRATAIRVSGADRQKVARVCEMIRAAWTAYDRPDIGIVAEDGDGKHNAVSPSVIKRGDVYDVNIVLRSNIASEEYPDGVFHAHPEYHCIKKESLGLLETHGLFVLPGRLDAQLAELENCLKEKELAAGLSDFSAVFELAKSFDGLPRDAIRHAVGSVCGRMLSNAAVFKTDRDLDDFLRYAGFEV